MRSKAVTIRERAEGALPLRLRQWLRFVTGLALLAMTAGFFMSGLTPPGVCGEVLRHNQTEGINASPLFYSEVENMAALEDGVQKLRRSATGDCLPAAD